jgi:hypothetical protein
MVSRKVNRAALLTPRFGLRWLLILVALVAGVMWLATQLGMVTAYFEIKENSLQLQGDTVAGELRYRFARQRSDDVPETYFFVCSIANLSKPELLDLQPGDKIKLRYRSYNIGPFKKQNPYEMFLIDKLGIRREYLKGWAYLEGIQGDWVQVAVNGAE